MLLGYDAEHKVAGHRRQMGQGKVTSDE